ncbi:uncharacterized protein CHAB577_0552 [Chlamydia abortus]|nr:uncharacterized protein CHAB577_0552 [Chlamydia abortus]CAD7584432.1 hypothetical protein [Chlamydia abortus]
MVFVSSHFLKIKNANGNILGCVFLALLLRTTSFLNCQSENCCD